MMGIDLITLVYPEWSVCFRTEGVTNFLEDHLLNVILSCGVN